MQVSADVDLGIGDLFDGDVIARGASDLPFWGQIEIAVQGDVLTPNSRKTGWSVVIHHIVGAQTPFVVEIDVLIRVPPDVIQFFLFTLIGL
jgi:hypothetical protein